MKKIFLLFSLLTIANIQFICAKNVTDSNEISIDNIKATASKLDPAVRSVLLKAIDRLERQVDSDNEQDKGNTENPNFIPTIQFYTASAEDVSQNVSPDNDIILKTILKNVASTKESNEDESKKPHFPSSNSLNSQSEQKNNNQQTRSISTDKSNEISEESKNAYITPTTIRPKLSSIRFKPTSTRPTTTTTTTTTTKKPAPTHNEDGENIEVVEKNDIKIFKAPLVTAFSVQQDDKGTLKKVVPLYNEVTASSTTTEPLKPQLQPLFNGGAVIEKLKVTAANGSNILLPTPAPTQSTITITSTTRPISNEPTGIPIPSFLRQEQQQNLFSAQQTPPIAPAPAFNNNPNSQSLNNFLFERQRFLEQQILQLQIQARQQQEQIIIQQRLLEEQRRAKSEERSGLKDQQQINSQLSIPEHLQPRTRHFRQENGVGNFGTNSFFNSAEPSSNRFGEFTRQRNGFNQQQDHQSQNILFQPSGILTNNFEDFSVINKVLALNHGINPYTTTHNFQFSNPGQFGGNF